MQHRWDTPLQIGPLTLDGRVLVAAGPWADGSDPQRLGVRPGCGVGAIVTKTVTPIPREGSQGPLLLGSAEAPLNRIGLRNPGIDAAAEALVRPLAALGIPVILSVAAPDPGALAGCEAGLRAALAAGAVAVELNVSCPNATSALPVPDAASIAAMVSALVGLVDVPVLVKLPPDPWRIAAFGLAAQGAGAAAIVATNTLPAAAPGATAELWDGGVSGAALHPVALRCVRELASVVSIPVIGVGGVADPESAAAMRMAGAAAVAVGGAHLTAADAAAGLAAELLGRSPRMGSPAPARVPASGSRLRGDTATQRLAARVGACTAGLCVGLDPDPAMHRSAADPLAAAEQHLRAVIDAVHPLVAAFKPNVAMFERWGSRGWAVLERLVRAIPADVPVILDAKRGDVPSTQVHSAAMCFEHLDVDAVTVNPLLGVDSIEPFLTHPGRLVILLAATSNPGAAELQGLETDGVPLSLRLAGMADRLDRRSDDARRTHVGVVAGATRPELLARVRQRAPEAWILIPGVGTQGGALDASLDAGAQGPGTGGGTLVNASRSIIYPRTEDVRTIAHVHHAAQELHDALVAHAAVVLV